MEDDDHFFFVILWSSNFGIENRKELVWRGSVLGIELNLTFSLTRRKQTDKENRRSANSSCSKH